MFGEREKEEEKTVIQFIVQQQQQYDSLISFRENDAHESIVTLNTSTAMQTKKRREIGMCVEGKISNVYYQNPVN